MHYLEAVLYSKIDPFAVNRVLLREFQIPVGYKRQKKPWFVSYTLRCCRALLFDSLQVFQDVHIFGGIAGEVKIVLPEKIFSCVFTTWACESYLRG